MFASLPVHCGPGWTVHHADCVALLQEFGENTIDAIATDPPYHLTSIVKRFGGTNAAPQQFGTDGAYRRASAGFMGRTWDGGDVAFRVETWEAAYRVLKPGGYIVAFASAKGYHRMACAIEDAGFIVHPLIGWAFGSGFPKAHNVSRKIDKELGATGRVEATGKVERRIRPGADRHKTGSNARIDGEFQPGTYIPATPQAAQWQGWFYGGQVRKPAIEPIFIGQKPFSERNGALNVMRWGTGAVNIDACRVETVEKIVIGRRGHSGDNGIYGDDGRKYERPGSDLGRWPANLIHDGSAEVVELFPREAGARAPVRGDEPSDVVDGIYQARQRVPGAFHADTGSAARFFEAYQPDESDTYFLYQPPDLPPLIYCSKANKADRVGSRHPTVKPVKLIRSLVRHITPPGGMVLDMFAGTGTTLQAARLEGFNAIGIEQDASHVVDIVWRMRHAAT